MSATRGRQRKLDPVAQAKLCQLVAAGSTIAAAADRVGVTLRTVQREVSANEDFEHDLRLAEEAAPVDPLKLMQAAAKAHWRAAAWLLERTDPETYGKRPPGACTAAQFHRALDSILAAALEGVPPDVRHGLYQSFQAAAHKAQTALFPGRGPDGRPPLKGRTDKLQPPVDPQQLFDLLNSIAAAPEEILSPEMQPPVEPPTTPPHTSPAEDAPRQNSSPQQGASQELAAPPANFVAKNEHRDKATKTTNPTPKVKSQPSHRNRKSRHSQVASGDSRLPTNFVAKNTLDQQLDALEARALYIPRRVG